MHTDALPFESAGALPATRYRVNLWPYFLQLVGITSVSIGIFWDISWHETIGRDTFWTPAHLAIQLGGILNGAVSAWLIYQATFVPASPFAAASVRIFGLRGPIGAWITLWGSGAMVVSAPFDNWWHNTYGLDVEILSPPHSILAAGMFTVVLGTVLLVVGYQNRTGTHGDRTGRLAFLYACGLMLAISSMMLMEHSFPNQQHGRAFYVACGIVYPAILIAVARAAKAAWPATTVAGIYMTVYLLLIWILPLFPAEPQLAPIYNRVDHMVPPAFPVWLVVPGLALDLLLRCAKAPRRWFADWLLAPVLGTIFFGLIVATQWYFSEFMLTPAADNWFFSGQGHWPYWTKPNEWRTRFWSDETELLTWSRAVLPWLVAMASAGVGLFWGNWMARVKR